MAATGIKKVSQCHVYLAWQHPTIHVSSMPMATALSELSGSFQMSRKNFYLNLMFAHVVIANPANNENKQMHGETCMEHDLNFIVSLLLVFLSQYFNYLTRLKCRFRVYCRLHYVVGWYAHNDTKINIWFAKLQDCFIDEFCERSNFNLEPFSLLHKRPTSTQFVNTVFHIYLSTLS